MKKEINIMNNSYKKHLLASVLSIITLVCSTKAANLPVPKECAQNPESIEDAFKITTPIRERFCLNGLWRARPVANDEDSSLKNIKLPAIDDDWGWGRIPGFICKFGLGAAHFDDMPIMLAPRFAGKNLPKDANNQMWYRRTFKMPNVSADKRVILTLEEVNIRADVWVDGEKAGFINWPETEIDITKFVKSGKEQTLHIFLSSDYPIEWQREWSEAFMGATSDMIFKQKGRKKTETRGILGNTWLDILPKGPRATFAWGDFSITNNNSVTFTIETEGVKEGEAFNLEVNAKPLWGGETKNFKAKNVIADKKGCLSFSSSWQDVALWDPDTPFHLYEVSMSIFDKNGNHIDDVIPFETGFREVRIEGKHVLLNGRAMHLRTILFSDQSRPCYNTYLGGMEFCKRIKVLNFNSFNMNVGYMPGNMNKFEEIYRAANHNGMLVMNAVIPRITDAPLDRNELWKNKEMQKLYRERAEKAIRLTRRHPSVVLYKMNMNITGYEEGLFPRGPGSIEKNDIPADQNERAVRKSALWSAECVNSIDPTRPAYNHDSGALGKFHTKNIYLGWAPPQERADWLEDWAKHGTLPINWCEFGTPDVSRFQSARRPYFIYRTPSWQNNWVAECSAEWFGESVFKGSKEVHKAMKAEDEHFAKESTVFQRNGMQARGIDSQYEQTSDVMGFFWAETLKGFRGWGLHGVLPWCWNKLYTYKVPVGRRKSPEAWKDLKQPGLHIEYISGEMRYGSQYPGSEVMLFPNLPWDKVLKLTNYGKAQQRWSKPTIGFIGGGRVFTEKRSNYSIGEKISKRLVMISDRMKKVNCKWTWKVICEKTSKQILQKSGETLVPQGGRNDVEFSFTPPKEGKWRIEASFVFEGDEEQKDSFVVQVLQKQKFIASRRGIALYDPKGLTKKELDRLGISYSLLQKLTSDCKEGTIAIGRECMTRELWDNVIIPAAVKGKDVVCFEQAKGDLEDIGFRVQERGLRKAWMRYNDPRLSNVISDDCLHDWAGESTLVDPDWAIKSDVPKDRLHRPTQMWAGYEMTRIVRANNRGCIATIIPEKPQVGDWRALADGLFALEYSPLLQMRTGGGSITMCQLDVTARTIPDVAADNIITKLLTIRHGPDGGKRPEFLGRDAEMMGYSWGIKSWGNCDDLLVSTGAKVPEDLEKRVANGATILCLGMTADEVKAWSCGEKVDVKQNEKHYFSRIEKIPAELNGLSNADFFWHGAMEFAAFSDSGAEGNAAFRIVRHGKGRVIFWQLPPWKFNIDERPHLRSSRRASARMAARLFGNIGWATFTDGTGYNNRPQYKDAPEAKDDPYEWVNL